MTKEYIVAKEQPEKRDISYMYVFFKNGDFLQIRENEIIDVNLRFYDNLILHKREFSPVCESGYIKLKIQGRKARYESNHLYDPIEFEKDRRFYIENRLTKEGGIDHICIFNENNWHKAFFGDAYAEMDENYLFIRYKPNDLYGSCQSVDHVVRAGDLTKNTIEKIDLDFENCESFEIFGEEIADIQLELRNELEWNSSGYGRKLKAGFIKLKLNPDITWRKVNLHDEWLGKRTKGISKLIKRLCGRSEDCVDICNLYVTYNYAGYGMEHEEVVAVDDVRPIEFYDRYDDEDDYDDIFISGYAEKQKDGSVIIFFGGDPNSDLYKKWLS